MARDNWAEMSDTGNWNVAGDYTRLKIMKLLYYLDEYETIAKFGTSEMVEEFVIDDATKNQARMKAIKRFVRTLLLLIGNTKFALKKEDKPIFDEWKETLKRLEKVLPMLETRITNQVRKTTEIKINEEKFNCVLDILIEIKENINEPLNKADLIFTYRDEFDPDEYKAAVKRKLITTG